MTRRSKSLLRVSISIAVALGLLVLTFRGMDAGQLGKSIADADYLWMGVSMVCLMVSHVFRAMRWRFLLSPIKSGIGLRNLFSSVMVGYFMNNILPRGGELVRPYAIGKLESLSKSAALGTIVVERLLDTLSFLLLVAIIPLVYDGPLLQAFPWLEQTGWVLSVITVGLLSGAFTLMVRRDWTDRVTQSLGKILPARVARAVDAIAHSFLDGFLFLKNPGAFVSIGMLSLVIWLLYLFMTFTALVAFDLEGLGIGASVVLLAISNIGVAIPTPGATGSYHWFASQTLVRLFRTPDAVALSYATVTHAIGYVLVSLVGGYYLLRDHISISAAMERPTDQPG
jgi:uncharacterized protein (TIRG00374 family)